MPYPTTDAVAHAIEEVERARTALREKCEALKRLLVDSDVAPPAPAKTSRLANER
jgi:hypothetical protein